MCYKKKYNDVIKETKWQRFLKVKTTLIQKSPCKYNAILKVVSRNYCRSGRAINITYTECVFVAILPTAACPSVKYFSSTLSQKWRYFQERNWKVKFVLICSTTSCKIFLILIRIKRDTTINVYRPLVRFQWNSNFLDKFSINTQISYLKNIREVGAELFHADGRTGVDRRRDRHDTGNSHFPKFCERAYQA